MDPIKYIIVKLFKSIWVIFITAIVLTMIYCTIHYLASYRSFSRLSSSSLRTSLLTDVHRLPAQLRCKDSLPLRNLADRLRIYRKWKMENVFENHDHRLILTEFEKNIFPWMRTTDSSFNDYQDGIRGIVMCLNDKYMKLGISSIMALKAVGNQLPIEIMFYENSELSLNNRNILRQLPFVARIIDMSNVFNNLKKYLPIGTPIRRTYGKPFAILASSFQYVLMMDVDVYFFQQPSSLFYHSGYLSTGFLIFSDRTIWPHTNRTAWIKSIMPKPYSDKFDRSRLVRGISSVEYESGVVVVNKGIRTSYLALLAICMLNTRCYRYEMLKNYQFRGEKETYWLGLEMLGVPYYQESTVGLVGDTNKQGDTVCGHTFHADELQNPLWWNGGFRSRKDKFSRWINFTSYVWESENATAAGWGCLTRSRKHVKNLTNQQLALIQNYKKYNCTTFYC